MEINVFFRGHLLELVLYLTTLGGFSVAEFNGDTDDIFIFTPDTLGNNTSGSFGTFWDGDIIGFKNEWIDGLFLE